LRRIILWFQRLLVFALGAVTVWLIAFVFLDLDERHRIPWFVALALSYGIAAYVILPHAIRIGLRTNLAGYRRSCVSARQLRKDIKELISSAATSRTKPIGVQRRVRLTTAA